jgi:hypothetical protein
MEVKCFREFLLKLFTLNAEKGELYYRIKPGRRSPRRAGDLAGGISKLSRNPYWTIRIKGTLYLRSRLIFLMENRYLPHQVDHENHNTLDDRPSNLRPCPDEQNYWNRTKYKNNSTGFKGVFHTSGSKTFRAQIRVNKKAEYLGCFNTAEEAHIMYCFAAIFYFGEFACG